MLFQTTILVGMLIASLAHLSSRQAREDILETRVLDNGAKIALVRIHPPPRNPQTEARGTWQFVLRYEPPRGSHQILLQDFGPEDNMPLGELPSDPLQLVEVAGKERLLAVAFNAHGYCWLRAWEVKDGGSCEDIAFYLGDNRGNGALAPSADQVEFVFARDGSITATLGIEDRHIRFVLKPEKRKADPGHPYPWPTPGSYFISPWQEIPIKE